MRNCILFSSLGGSGEVYTYMSLHCCTVTRVGWYLHDLCGPMHYVFCVVNNTLSLFALFSRSPHQNIVKHSKRCARTTTRRWSRSFEATSRTTRKHWKVRCCACMKTNLMKTHLRHTACHAGVRLHPRCSDSCTEARRCAVQFLPGTGNRYPNAISDQKMQESACTLTQFVTY